MLSSMHQKTRKFVERLRHLKNSELLTILGITFVGISYWGPDRFWPNWVALYVVFSLGITYDVYKNYSKLISVLTGYLLLHVVYLGTFRLTAYDKMAAVDRLVLKYHAMEFGFCVLACVLAGKILLHYKVKATRVLTFLFYIHFAYTILTWFTFPGPYGFTGNFGMNTGLMAVLSAFAPLPWMIPVGVAVLLTKASSPLLVFGVILAARLWAIKYGKPLVLLSAAAAVGLVLKVPEYLNDSARFINWGYYWEYFTKSKQTIVGLGTEVFKSFGPYLQTIHGEKSQYLLWAHNEYLEITFNYGFLGLFLVCAVVLFGIYNAYRKQNMAVVYGLLGMAAMSTTNYPLRLAPTFIVCMLLIHSAYTEKNYE